MKNVIITGESQCALFICQHSKSGKLWTHNATLYFWMQQRIILIESLFSAFLHYFCSYTCQVKPIQAFYSLLQQMKKNPCSILTPLSDCLCVSSRTSCILPLFLLILPYSSIWPSPVPALPPLHLPSPIVCSIYAKFRHIFFLVVWQQSASSISFLSVFSHLSFLWISV